MNVPIDVCAAISSKGDMKPVYIQIERNHIVYQCRVSVIYESVENYSGTPSIVYVCRINIENEDIEIQIKYYINSHRWYLVNENNTMNS